MQALFSSTLKNKKKVYYIIFLAKNIFKKSFINGAIQGSTWKKNPWGSDQRTL